MDIQTTLIKSGVTDVLANDWHLDELEQTCSRKKRTMTKLLSWKVKHNHVLKLYMNIYESYNITVGTIRR